MSNKYQLYFPSRPFTNFIKEIVTPGQDIDWMALNLYLHLLVLDQFDDGLGHIPWDLIDAKGIPSETSADKVMTLFAEDSFMQIPKSWVR
jgi:hypothetical protein